MSKPPVIGMVTDLPSCIKALQNIRAYFAEPVVVTPTAKTIAAPATNTVTTIALPTVLTDAGGTGLTGTIQIRFMGLNPDGSNSWQLEVV